MQDLVASNIIKVEKVGNKENPADAMTKYVPTSALRYHLPNVGWKANYMDIGRTMVTTRSMS